ncbi:MAG: DUF433 domain-containing protein [Gemmataceae bacterium]
MANATIAPQAVPLTLDAHGTWRVTGTHVPLERVIECYQQGDTPEAIVESFDALQLADVYAVISYYLNHTAEVDAYLRAGEAEAAEVRRRIEARQPPRPGMRAELLARRARMEAGDAPPGQ